MPGQPFPLAEERQLVNRVAAEAVRAVITGTRAIGVTVERVLRRRDLARRLRVEDFRGVVNERAPGVMHAHAEVPAQPLIETDLHLVIDRRGGVVALADDSPCRINANRRVLEVRRGEYLKAGSSRFVRAAMTGFPSTVWNSPVPLVATYPTRTTQFFANSRWTSRLYWSATGARKSGATVVLVMNGMSSGAGAGAFSRLA